MTVNKLTYPAKQNEVQQKINEIIDNLGGGGGSVAIDNITITENASNELQTVAVIDAHDGVAKEIYKCTRAEYETLKTNNQLDANTYYSITDDTNTTLTLLELLYPVGSIYIGTMNACPLQALGIGTWQLVATDRVLQGATDGSVVGTTKAAGLPNITGAFRGVQRARTLGASGSLTAGTYQGTAGWSGDTNGVYDLNLDASLSSSIYGNSNTVQPPAYLVNIWERIS